MTRQRVLNNMLQDVVDVSGLHATGLNGQYPTSGAGMEMYYNPPTTSAVIQAYDRGGSAWRDLVINVRNLSVGLSTLLTSKLYIGAPAPSTPFLRLLTASGSLGIESPGEYLMLCSKNGIHVCGNAYWDGAGWYRYDTSVGSTLYIASAGGAQVYTAPAGTGTIPWQASASLTNTREFWMPATAWTTVTYQNGFTAQSGWGPVQYMRDSAGVVHFRGLLSSPASGWGHGTPAFTLPAGYRLGVEAGSPGPYHHFASLSDGMSLGGITIFGTGIFSPWLAAGSASTGSHWWDLSSIHYMSELAG